MYLRTDFKTTAQPYLPFRIDGKTLKQSKSGMVFVLVPESTNTKPITNFKGLVLLP